MRDCTQIGKFDYALVSAVYNVSIFLSLNNITKRKHFASVVIFLVALLTVFCSVWQSPNVNLGKQYGVHNCIYNYGHHTASITSMWNLLDVNYIENTDSLCVNPYFPSIHITTKSDHNAWLHVVYTDSVYPRWQQFIDTVDQGAHSTIYPFYTLEQDFYDTPHWIYGLFSKPLSLWIGHVYAVKVDHENKTIECKGGVSWGFGLSYLHLRPQMIAPTSLQPQDWQKDWLIFKTVLVGYKNL